MKTTIRWTLAAIFAFAPVAFVGCERSNPYDNQPDGTVDRVERTEEKGIGFEDGKLQKTESVEERPIDK